MNRIILGLALVCVACSPSKEVVMVYSPHGPDMLGDYERLFEAAHPEVDLQWIDEGSQTIYTRIKNEAKRPIADVSAISSFDQGLSAGCYRAVRLLRVGREPWFKSVGARSGQRNKRAGRR